MESNWVHLLKHCTQTNVWVNPVYFLLLYTLTPEVSLWGKYCRFYSTKFSDSWLVYPSEHLFPLPSVFTFSISQPSSIQSLFPLLLSLCALFGVWYCDENNQKRIHMLLSQCILISKCSKRLNLCIPITIVFSQRTITPGPLPNSCYLFHVRRVCRSVILFFFKD